MTQEITATVTVEFMLVWPCNVQYLLTNQNDRLKREQP